MKRLLYIAHRVPYPPDKGERVRAFHEIQALAEHFRVTVAALAHSPADRESARSLEPWCERVITAPAGGTVGLTRGAMTLLRGRSVTEGYFRSRRLARAVRREAAREPFDVVLAYSSGALPYALAVPAGARVADLVDVDSAKWAAYAGQARWPISRLYRREAAGVRRLERQALRRCDAVCLVSDAEAAALEADTGNVLAVGNGVDTEYFRPQDRPKGVPPTLVFTGTMDYRPNVEGVCWFAEAVWPRLKVERPDLRFTIVGRDPAPAVRRLAEMPGIEVTGTVPDVRPYLARAALAVVPLVTARGIQNKVLEAMAMGRAVAASPGAIEGLDVQPGAEVRVPTASDGWGHVIRDLLANTPEREAVERAARARVERCYTWAARLRPFIETCTRLADRPPAAADGNPGAANGPPPDDRRAALRPEASAP